jgi:hypothetical protein
MLGGNNFTVVTSPSTPCSTVKIILDKQYKAVMRGKGKPETDLQEFMVQTVMVKSGNKSRLDINSDAPIGDSLANNAVIMIMVRKQPPPALVEATTQAPTDNGPISVTFVSEADGFTTQLNDIAVDTTFSTLVSKAEQEYKESLKSSSMADVQQDITISSLTIIGASGIRFVKAFDAPNHLSHGDNVLFKFKRGTTSVKTLGSLPAEFLRSAGIITFPEEQDPSPLQGKYEEKQQQMTLGTSTGVSDVSNGIQKQTFAESFIVSGKMILIDPSYKKPEEGSFLPSETILDNVHPGEWSVSINTHQGRIKQLVCHSKTIKEPATSTKWKKAGSVPVDSTFIGVFDMDGFEGGNYERERPGMYTAGQSNTDVAFYPEGIVIKAGLGDGHYTVETASTNDTVHDIRIIFF